MGMRKLLLLLLFAGKKKAILKPWTPATAPAIYRWKKLLVPNLIMEDLTYSVRIVPKKSPKWTKVAVYLAKRRQQKY